MPTPPKSVANARARKAGLIKHGHGPDDPRVIEADRDLAAENLAAYIERVVAEAPPLTDHQLGRLAALLRPAARTPNAREAA